MGVEQSHVTNHRQCDELWKAGFLAEREQPETAALQQVFVIYAVRGTWCSILQEFFSVMFTVFSKCGKKALSVFKAIQARSLSQYKVKHRASSGSNTRTHAPGHCRGRTLTGLIQNMPQNQGSSGQMAQC